MTDYYVDPLTGSSGNSGTSKGSAKASFRDFDGDSFSAGDNIFLVAEDTSPVTDSMTGRVHLENVSGTLSNPVTITTYSGNTTAYVMSWAGGSQNDGVVFSQCNHLHVTADTLSPTAAGGLALTEVDDNVMIWRNFVASDSVGLRLENVWFEDYGNNTPTREGNGLFIQTNVYDWDVINCRFRDGSAYRDSDGMYIGGNTTDGRAGDGYIENTIFEYNCDDGIDFYRSDPAKGSVMVDCVARYNGRDLATWNSGNTDGTSGNWGDGNGFKVGGDAGGSNVLYRCTAYYNRGRQLGGAGVPDGDGFDDNGSPDNTYLNCTSHANQKYGFQSSGTSLYINNVAHDNGTAPVLGSRSDENNSWDLGGVTVTDADFVSVDPADYGSGYLVPASGSDLVDAGVELDGYVVDFDAYSGSSFTINMATTWPYSITETFTGTSPDLGATEATGGGTTTDTAGLVGVTPGMVAPAESATFDTDATDNPGLLAIGAGIIPPTESPTVIPTATDNPGYISATLGTPFYFGHPETEGVTPAGGTTLLEDGESYSDSDYTGDTGNFAQSSSRAYAGSNSVSTSGAGAIWYTASADGDTPNDGCTFEGYVWAFAGPQLGILFNASGTGRADLDGYEARLDLGFSDDLRIVRWDNGSETDIATVVDIDKADWREDWVKIEASIDGSGNISVTFDNTEDGTVGPTTLTATDTTHTSGDLGFQASDSSCHFDNLSTCTAGGGNDVTDSGGYASTTGALVAGGEGVGDNPGLVSATAALFVTLGVPATDNPGRIDVTPAILTPGEVLDAVDSPGFVTGAAALFLTETEIDLTATAGLISAGGSLVPAMVELAEDDALIPVTVALRQGSPTAVSVEDPGLLAITAGLLDGEDALATDAAGLLGVTASLLATETATAADSPGYATATASLLATGAVGLGDTAGPIDVGVSILTPSETFPLIATAILLGHFGDPSELDGFMYDGTGGPLE